MKIGNTTLIPQNVAPPGARKIAVCDTEGNVRLKCELGNLAMPELGTLKYSAGVVADAHTTTISSVFGTAEDSQADLTRAIQYFAPIAKYTFVCGDMCSFCDDGGLEKHWEIINVNRGDMEVFGLAGNHEHYSREDKVVQMTDDVAIQHTGYPLRYSVERDGDVFIMCGAVTWGAVFDQAGIQWLYKTLESNRNKRCFLFVHCFLKGGQYCGDSTGIVDTVDMTAAYKSTFLALLRHYKNVIYFHGHSHVMGQMQEYTQSLDNPLPANYDHACGIHSVHIPSLSYPRDISSGATENMFGESQGILMDVYASHVVMRYRNFVKGEFIPIATYCLDTALVEIEAGTFTDSTGTIVT